MFRSGLQCRQVGCNCTSWCGSVIRTAQTLASTIPYQLCGLFEVLQWRITAVYARTQPKEEISGQSMEIDDDQWLFCALKVYHVFIYLCWLTFFISTHSSYLFMQFDSAKKHSGTPAHSRLGFLRTRLGSSSKSKHCHSFRNNKVWYRLK